MTRKGDPFIVIMTSSEFVAKLIDVAEHYNTTYMWGVFGSPVTTSLIEQKVKQYPNFYTGNYQEKLKKMVNQDVFAFDCVCLIKGILWGWTGDKDRIYGGARYASGGVPDINADTMIRRCTDLSTDFSKIEPGEALGIRGHIGVYIGDGKVVECTTDWSCKVQITYLGNLGKIDGYSGRRWDQHGKLPYLIYDTIAEPEVPEEPDASEKPADPQPLLEVGDRVTVRKDAKTYDGKSLASFVYKTTFDVQSIAGDRAVIGREDVVTAAMHPRDLIKV